MMLVVGGRREASRETRADSYSRYACGCAPASGRAVLEKVVRWRTQRLRAGLKVVSPYGLGQWRGGRCWSTMHEITVRDIAARLCVGVQSENRNENYPMGTGSAVNSGGCGAGGGAGCGGVALQQGREARVVSGVERSGGVAPEEIGKVMGGNVVRMLEGSLGE